MRFSGRINYPWNLCDGLLSLPKAAFGLTQKEVMWLSGSELGALTTGTEGSKKTGAQDLSESLFSNRREWVPEWLSSELGKVIAVRKGRGTPPQLHKHSYQLVYERSLSPHSHALCHLPLSRKEW